MKYDFERLPYQKRWVEWARDKLRLANFSKTGTGKTVMTIDWINKTKLRSILVICPKSAMKHTWYDALKDNFQHDILTICKGDMKRRRKLMENYLKDGFKGAFIINYDIIHKHEFELCNMAFDCVVLDESHKIAGQSKRAEAAKKITSKKTLGLGSVLLLSGTPSPKDLLGYYNQMAIVTGSKKYTFFSWRKKFFDAFTVPNTMITTYTPKPGAKKMILDTVSKLSFTATEEDCKQLPDRTRAVKSIPLSSVQESVYNALLEDYAVTVNDTVIECNSNAARATKLLQVASGFIYDNDGNAIELSKNRTNMMLDTIESFGENEQCVIWYAYKWQREQICKALKCDAYSSLSDKNKEKYVENFVNGKNKYFVAHPKSCGESLTLVNCNHEIWYCLNGDLRGWMQAGDRICRLGQEKSVVSVTLQSEDTYDESVYDGILNGFDNDKIIMEFFRSKS